MMLRLPDPLPPMEVPTPVSIDKTAFFRFDTNADSVPHEFVSQTPTLVADDRTARVLNPQGEVVASHDRCWGRRQVIEDPKHRESLLAAKKGARESKGRDKLRAACPQIDVLVVRWVEAGTNVGSMTSRAVKLLDAYGADLFTGAVAEVITRGTWDLGRWRHRSGL